MSTAALHAYASSNDRSLLAASVGEMVVRRQEALRRLYVATSPLVNGWVLRVVEHPEDAEAVTLDIYLKAWRNASLYLAERGSVPAWLLAMARTVAAGRIRAHTMPEGQ